MREPTKRTCWILPLGRLGITLTPFQWSWGRERDCYCCLWNLYLGPVGFEYGTKESSRWTC